MNLKPAQNNNTAFDPAQLFKRIFSKWYYITISIAAFLVLAFFYNKYSSPKYSIVTTLQVKKQQTSNLADPIALIFNRASQSSVSLPDETVLLKSIPLLSSTINSLDVAVSYYYSNPLKNIELYKNSPIRVDIDINSTELPYGEEWMVKPLNGTHYRLTNSDGQAFNFKFNEKAKIKDFIFTVNVVAPDQLNKYDFIIFKLNNPFSLVMNYKERLNVIPYENSTIINLALVGETPQKEIDFLNALTENIIKQDIKNKRLNSERTTKFIDQQLSENTDSLQAIEGQIQKFKNKNVSVDLSVEGNQLYSNIKELEKQKASLLLNNEYYDHLLTTLEENSGMNENITPTSMDGVDPILSKLISQLVDLQLDVKLLLSEKKSRNPLLQEKQRTMVGLKANILSMVKNLKTKNNIHLRDINDRIAMFSASLQRIPEAERELVNIKRDYRINENLYLLFMQKRMEAGINAATITSDYWIINQPINQGIVSASPLRNYTVALLLGMILPIGILLLIDFAGNKIKTKEDVEKTISAPIICSVAHFDKNSKGQGPLTALESFRTLRANIRYLPQPAQVFMFTSSMSGEGKTYCSWHLAQVLALAQKKVIWIDADLRLQRKELPAKTYGLSEYLADFAPMDAVINLDKNNMHFIRSGNTPPNPAELLVNPRMHILIETLKQQFDYVIIDTPPLAAFSDAFEIMPLVDQTLLVVRQKFTKFSALKLSRELIENKDIQSLSVIYNDLKDKKSAYASAYYSSNGKAPKAKSFSV